MPEDKLLVEQLRHGSSDALHRIYETYKNELLALGVALSHDRTTAEDVVHDVFVSLAEISHRLRLRGSLKNYLAACVANRCRSLARTKQVRKSEFNDRTEPASDGESPAVSAISAEQSALIIEAMERLPYEQQEVIILHLQAGMKFRQIARQQDLSINTVQARYRYGLAKLRSMLNSEAKK